MRFEEGTQAGYGLLLSLIWGWRGGTSEAVHFLLQRELYNRKVLEIFRIPVQGEWHYRPHPPFPASVPFSRMNLDEEWEETQTRRFLCLAERRDVVCRVEMESENA